MISKATPDVMSRSLKHTWPGKRCRDCLSAQSRSSLRGKDYSANREATVTEPGLILPEATSSVILLHAHGWQQPHHVRAPGILYRSRQVKPDALSATDGVGCAA